MRANVLKGRVTRVDFPRNTVSWKIVPRVTGHRGRFSAQNWARATYCEFLNWFQKLATQHATLLRGKSSLHVDLCNTAFKLHYLLVLSLEFHGCFV